MAKVMVVPPEQVYRLVLDLSEEEARILKGLFQNPLCDDESKTFYELRVSIFVALKNQGF